MRDATRMLTVEEAQARVLGEIEPIGLERVPIAEALGRVLAESVTAPFDIPRRDNTAMDGFAVWSEDVAGATPEAPVVLDVIETIPAGYVPSLEVAPGTAARIMTGASIPEGADAVVIVENTEAEGDRVRIFKGVGKGANIRRRGEDVREGAVVLTQGAELGAGAVGLLASLCRGVVTVGRRPTVSIVSTGDELVDTDTEPGPGQIVNSNAYSLAALAREAGASPVVLPIARDSLDEIAGSLRAAAEADVVITSGGVSVGDFDYVKAALDALGAETRFWRVSMKPGKPVVFARLIGKPFFGLPGNPVSCMVGFHLFVRPALRKMMRVGEERLMRSVVEAVLANDVRSTGDRRNYLRAVVSSAGDRLVAATKPAQGSGVLSSMVGANGLVIVPEGTTTIAAGERVAVQLIGEL
jgi:molybdopterin molybdotransferase